MYLGCMFSATSVPLRTCIVGGPKKLRVVIASTPRHVAKTAYVPIVLGALSTVGLSVYGLLRRPSCLTPSSWFECLPVSV